MSFDDFKSRRASLLHTLRNNTGDWERVLQAVKESEWSLLFWYFGDNREEIQEDRWFETEVGIRPGESRLLIEDVLSLGSKEQIQFCLENPAILNSIRLRRWMPHYGAFSYFDDESIPLTMALLFLRVERRFDMCERVIEDFSLQGTPAFKWHMQQIFQYSNTIPEADWCFQYMEKNVNFDDPNQSPVLIGFVCAENYELVNYLFELGADVNRACNQGDTALLNAVYYEYDRMVALLIDKGANPFLRNCYKQSPMTLAKKKKRKDYVALFESVKSNFE